MIINDYSCRNQHKHWRNGSPSLEVYVEYDGLFFKTIKTWFKKEKLRFTLYTEGSAHLPEDLCMSLSIWKNCTQKHIDKLFSIIGTKEIQKSQYDDDQHWIKLDAHDIFILYKYIKKDPSITFEEMVDKSFCFNRAQANISAGSFTSRYLDFLPCLSTSGITCKIFSENSHDAQGDIYFFISLPQLRLKSHFAEMVKEYADKLSATFDFGEQTIIPAHRYMYIIKFKCNNLRKKLMQVEGTLLLTQNSNIHEYIEA